MTLPVLDIADLHVVIGGRGSAEPIPLLRGVGLAIGAGEVRGLVATGLNLDNQTIETGGNPSENRRDVYLYHDSCAIQSALARMAGLTPVRNAWMDTWASY